MRVRGLKRHHSKPLFHGFVVAVRVRGLKTAVCIVLFARIFVAPMRVRGLNVETIIVSVFSVAPHAGAWLTGDHMVNARI